MKYFFGFVFSIILHISIYYYFTNTKVIQKTYSKKKVSTTSIQYVKLKPKILKTAKKVVKRKKTTKKKIYKKKKRIVKKYKPKHKVKKIEKKDIKKIIPIPKVIKKASPKEDIAKQFIQKEPIIDEQTKELLALYGDDFKDFSKETKLYLIKNISDIGQITKRFLQYPYLSIQAEQSGQNVVEFILKPNGEISEPKIIKSAGYYLLDDNTVETINEAYSDYPRPSKPTLIKIFVNYKLY